MRGNHNNKCKLKQTKKMKIMNLYINNKKLNHSFCKLKMEEKFERNNMKKLLKKRYIKLKCGEPFIVS